MARFLPLGIIYIASGYSTQNEHIFVANGLDKITQSLDTTEGDLEVKKYSLEDLKKLLKTGKITNSATVSAFCLYLLSSK